VTSSVCPVRRRTRVPLHHHNTPARERRRPLEPLRWRQPRTPVSRGLRPDLSRLLADQARHADPPAAATRPAGHGDRRVRSAAGSRSSRAGASPPPGARPTGAGRSRDPVSAERLGQPGYYPRHQRSRWQRPGGVDIVLYRHHQAAGAQHRCLPPRHGDRVGKVHPDQPLDDRVERAAGCWVADVALNELRPPTGATPRLTLPRRWSPPGAARRRADISQPVPQGVTAEAERVQGHQVTGRYQRAAPASASGSARPPARSPAEYRPAAGTPARPRPRCPGRSRSPDRPARPAQRTAGPRRRQAAGSPVTPRLSPQASPRYSPRTCHEPRRKPRRPQPPR
jgi:hypothetical protein